MSRRRPGRPYRPNSLRKWREVRDVYNKLRRKYRDEPVFEFIKKNYFISPTGVFQMLQEVDSEPVTEPSLIYAIVMRDDFNL